MHRKSILGITGGQNQVKVTKGHQVQIFKKFIFELINNWTLHIKWSVEIQYPVRGLFLLVLLEIAQINIMASPSKMLNSLISNLELFEMIIWHLKIQGSQQNKITPAKQNCYLMNSNQAQAS